MLSPILSALGGVLKGLDILKELVKDHLKDSFQQAYGVPLHRLWVPLGITLAIGYILGLLSTRSTRASIKSIWPKTTRLLLCVRGRLWDRPAVRLDYHWNGTLEIVPLRLVNDSDRVAHRVQIEFFVPWITHANVHCGLVPSVVRGYPIELHPEVWYSLLDNPPIPTTFNELSYGDHQLGVTVYLEYSDMHGREYSSRCDVKWDGSNAQSFLSEWGLKGMVDKDPLPLRVRS